MELLKKVYTQEDKKYEESDNLVWGKSSVCPICD